MKCEKGATKMKLKKAARAIIQEAEGQGLMVGMASLIERKRTDLNNELSDYFRKQLSGYTGSFDENEGKKSFIQLTST